MAVPFVEPLALETILVNILSGTPEIFFAIAMFFIFGMAAYFRMSFTIMMFMFILFLVMFNLWIPNIFLIMITVIGFLIVGRWVMRIFSR